ncbi:MAG: acetolactate synthase small subunit [Chloroflexi bacterium]|nr:acetolactate synthase small subunit [Chloroflexota bacterium]MCH7655394.1 acetolactate synthase small subunit [Chloroflexota bacterium]
MAPVETHTITALVQDRPGVLARIAGMFSRRGFNISNLAVGHSETPGLSRMTFVVEGDDWVVEQVTKHLYKLIDVVQVYDISAESIVLRELALLKVRSNAENRPEIIQIVDIFRASIVDVTKDSLVIEVTGDEEKVDALIELLRPFGLREVMRTGRIAMSRGSGTTGGRKGTKASVDQSAPDAEVVP